MQYEDKIKVYFLSNVSPALPRGEQDKNVSATSINSIAPKMICIKIRESSIILRSWEKLKAAPSPSYASHFILWIVADLSLCLCMITPNVFNKYQQCILQIVLYETS